MSGQSSNTSQTASAFYDPESSCWRTSQGSLLSEAPPSLQRLPDWATTADGALCALAIPGHLTAVRDGSVLPNLPTPTANNAKESGTIRDWGGDLTAALLPTPRTPTGGRRVALRPLDQPQNLENAIARLLPTPVVNDMGRGKTPEEWDSWTDEMKHRHGNGNGHGASLSIEIARLPGIATRLRSNNGNGSSDDQHPTQPTTEDCDPSSSNG